VRAFSEAIEIAAAPERIWDVMRDIDRWPEWTPSMTSVHRLDDAPFAVGTRVKVRQPRLPAAIWLLTDIQPGRGFTWVSANPGVTVTATHVIAPGGEGSRVTLAIEMAGPFAALLGALTGGITQRYMALEARGLKARSEHPEYRHGR
jgi:uncharacterized membrane protein